MAKSKRNQRNSKRRTSKAPDQVRSLSAIGTVNRSVPRAVTTVHKVRRSWNQITSYSPGNGFFSASPNIQINFSASVSNINLGGVGVYGPTLPNSSEFAAIFDQWRITSVTLRCDWNINSFAPGNVNDAPPLLYYIADYDDSADANVSALLQYPGVRTHSFIQNGYTPLIYTFKPKPLKDIAGTGVLTSYAPDTSMPFIRTAEMATPHYGVKIATSSMGAASTTVTGYIMMTAYVDLEFVGVK